MMQSVRNQAVPLAVLALVALPAAIAFAQDAAPAPDKPSDKADAKGAADADKKPAEKKPEEKKPEDKKPAAAGAVEGEAKPGDKKDAPKAVEAKPPEKPAEKPADKPADKPAERPPEKVVDKPAEKPAERPVEKAVEKPVEKAAEKPADKPAEPAPPPAVVPEKEAVAAPKGKEPVAKVDADGWYFRLKSAGSLNLGSSSDVVGQPNGTSTLIGLNVDGSIDLKRKRVEWRNALLVNETLTRTPIIDEFIVSVDSLKIDSLFLNYFTKNFGLYARAGMDTVLFAHYDLEPTPASYLVKRIDGLPYKRTADRLQLTAPLSPTNFQEGAGPYARALSREFANLEVMLGLAARESLVKAGNLAVEDDPKTPERELAELQDTYQVGVEALMKFWGEVLDKKVAYTVAANLMYPFYKNPDPGSALSGADLVNVDLTARLDFKFVSWLGLAYEFRAVRQPLLVDAWQVQNMLLLTISYSMYKYMPL